MAGNVAELCGDEPTAEGVLVRGGSWDNAADSLKVTASYRIPPTATAPDIGFRCVMKHWHAVK